MADISQKLIARLGANLDAYKRGLRSAVSAAKTAGGNMRKAMATATRGAVMLGKAVALLSVALLGLGALAVREFIQWEAAMTGVAKTVDATDEQIRALGQTFVDMSESIPVAAGALAKLGEVAGQLGVEFPNIVSFVEVAAALGVSTNLAAEEAAVGLARMSNVMGTATKDVGRLGATIVDLGNNLATTEAEILDMTLRLTGVGKLVGLTEAQVLSFSAAMSSLGIRSEAGGSAMSRVFAEIAASVASGGEKLQTFAAVAGTSVENFSTRFKTDAAGAVVAFIEGLDRLSDAGENVFGVLEKVEFQDIRVRDTLLRAAGGVEILKKALEIGNVAWEENTALTDEANRFYDRLGARLTQLGNKIRNVAAEFGERLTPIVETSITIMSGFLDQVRDAGPAIGEFAESAAQKIPGMVESVVRGVGKIGLALLSVVEFFRDHPIAGAGGLLGLVFFGPTGAAAIGVIGAAIDQLVAKLGGPQTVFAAATKQLQELVDLQANLLFDARQIEGRVLFQDPERVRALRTEAAAVGEAILGLKRTIAGFTTEDFVEFGEAGASAFGTAAEGARSLLEAMAQFRLELGGGGEDTPFAEIKEDVEGIAPALGDAAVGANKLDTQLSGIASTITSGIGDAIGGILTGVQSAGAAFKRLAQTIIQDVISALVRAAVLTKLLGSAATAGATGGGSLFGSIFRGLLGFQTGGIVPGAGSAGRPILAHPGEVVLSRDAVAGLGGAVQANALNRGGGSQQPVNVSLSLDASQLPNPADFGIIATNPDMIRFVGELMRQVEFVRS